MENVTSGGSTDGNPSKSPNQQGTPRLDRSVLERLDLLEELLHELVERIDLEVRTRRLVVVEEDGFERVVLAGDGSHGAVTVTARGGAGGATAVELYAYDAWDGDGANVGLALVDQGDITGSFDVFEGRVPRLTAT